MRFFYVETVGEAPTKRGATPLRLLDLKKFPALSLSKGREILKNSELSSNVEAVGLRRLLRYVGEVVLFSYISTYLPHIAQPISLK